MGTTSTSRWGESPLPYDHEYCPIPGWVRRNLRYFTNRRLILNKETGDVEQHPDFGRQVGLTRCESRLFFEIMSHKYDRENSRCQVRLKTVADNLGITIRAVQMLLKNLKDKGAVKVIHIDASPNIYDWSELIQQCKEYEVKNTANEEAGYTGDNTKKKKRVATAKKLLGETSDSEEKSDLQGDDNRVICDDHEGSCVSLLYKDKDIERSSKRCITTKVVIETDDAVSNDLSNKENQNKRCGMKEKADDAVNNPLSFGQESIKDSPPAPHAAPPAASPFDIRPRDGVIIPAANQKAQDKARRRAMPTLRSPNQTRLIEWTAALVEYFMGETFTGKAGDWKNPMYGPHIRAAKAFLLAENTYWGVDNAFDSVYDLEREPKQLIQKMIGWMETVKRWTVTNITSAGLVRHLGEFAKYWQAVIERRCDHLRKAAEVKAQAEKAHVISAIPTHSDGRPRYLELKTGESAKVVGQTKYEDGTIRRIWEVTLPDTSRKLFNEVVYPGETDPHPEYNK